MGNQRTLLLIGSAVLIPLALWALSGQMPGTLYFDQSGAPHGTGTQRAFYGSGKLKLEDRFFAGELVEETWYKPDGTVLANEKFVSGCGVGYYLRDDGSIRVKMTYVDGISEGTATYFSTNGEVTHTAEFVRGQKVGG